MQSKEDKVKEIFFNHPTRRWHFEEILKEAGITRSKADRWLKKFVKREIIKKVKKKGKMPYYISNYANANYQNKKKIFALQRIYASGLLNYLNSLKRAKAVILFGSFARWDWYKESDVDLFIYGDTEGLDVGKYELKLHRNIQVFVSRDENELKKYSPGLLRNIIKGNIIKGDLPLEVIKNASI